MCLLGPMQAILPAQIWVGPWRPGKVIGYLQHCSRQYHYTNTLPGLNISSPHLFSALFCSLSTPACPPSTPTYWCWGAFIGHWHVTTAAHCMQRQPGCPEWHFIFWKHCKAYCTMPKHEFQWQGIPIGLGHTFKISDFFFLCTNLKDLGYNPNPS